MSQTETLRKLEQVLESFLERAVELKEDRLRILSGINRLDDIAQGVHSGHDLTDAVGNWFADHNRWLSEGALRPTDQTRISEILTGIKRELSLGTDDSAALGKIKSEIDRWNESTTSESLKITLRRGPETAGTIRRPEGARLPDGDTISPFRNLLANIGGLYEELSDRKVHLLSVLDDSLNKATLQGNKEALLLSAVVIYYLKQNSYKVEPYVKRLKDAERRQRGER